MAARSQPAADLSAMDGYAMQTGDGPWQVIGESAAGHPFTGELGPGQAIRISTGALMPHGADAVLLQENALRDGDHLALNGLGAPTARHIRRAGFDFSTGAPVLPAGTLIGPAQLALAIMAGHQSMQVHRQPRVAIIDSGDELSPNPAACAPHQIPASNGAMLAAMMATSASSIQRIGPVPDQMHALAAALDQASGADVVVTSGGASVGDHDLILPALRAWGAEVAFWRVAIKPGKPLLMARKGAQIVIGLPGNPVSSYVTAFLFLLPLLRGLAGHSAPLPRRLNLPLGADLPPGDTRTEFLRARIEAGTVMPQDQQDSSALRSLATSHALIERPIGCPASLRGSMVPVYLLQNGGIG
jgi:molybdopterin molybdotransferase